MARRSRPLFPRAQRRLGQLGDRLRLARLRRRIPLVEMAARVGVTRPTYRRLEAGDAAVSLGLLVRVLSALGLEDDIDRLAETDEIGRRLEDISLTRPRRSRRRE